MLNFNYEYLKLFSVVTTTATLKDTAKILGVTPSAVSQSLKKLEADIGFQLFLREQKRLILSPKGIELKNKLLPLLTQLENEINEQLTQGSSHEPSGILTIGAPFEMGSTLVVKALARFIQQYPKVKARLKFSAPQKLLEFVQEGEVDFAICADGTHFNHLSPNFSRKKIFDEEMVVVAPKSWCSNISFENLIKLPHLDYNAEGSAIGMWYQHHYKKLPKKINITLVAENALSLIEGVKENLGIAMVPLNRLKNIIKNQKLSIIKPSDKKFLNPIIVLQHQNKIPSMAEKKFLEMFIAKRLDFY